MTLRAVRVYVAAGVAAAMGAALATMTARAQSIPVERARTWVTGRPTGSRTNRVDASRTGLTETRLPMSGLRIEWRASMGSVVDNEPVVDARGGSYIVGARGEVAALGRDGTERWRVPTGALDPGPAALLSDDTVVFVDGSGDAIGLRDGGIRWHSRFGRADSVHPSPLPLDDGGIVVATSRDLALLDAQGRQRGRTTLPEPTAAPLISALGQVIAVTVSGAIWGWVPGAAEATHVASFGSPIEGGAALSNAHSVVAVTNGRSTFATVDLLRGNGGAAAPRAVASNGLWLGSPAMCGETATLALLGPASELVVVVDGAGRELRRALLVGHVSLPRSDAGASSFAPSGLPDAPILVDGAGTVAFATLEGSVGVAAIGAGEDGSVEVLSDACPRPVGLTSSTGTVAGLAPLPPQSFIALCRSGTVLAITGPPPTK
jgi:hypothetical protein